MSDYQKLYEDYHSVDLFDNFGENTFQGLKAKKSYPNTISTLDFGCGNGYAVKRMRELGESWYGLEYSKMAFDRYLQEPFFFHGTTKQFEDKQFDMGYSTDVFEHIPEDIIDETIKDFCRVINRYIFMTISLRPSTDNNKYHCTLKPRSWWEKKFIENGFVLDENVIYAHQLRTIKSTKKILEAYSCFGPDAEAFAKTPPYELNGEREFYYFCFHREGLAAPDTPKPTISWINKKGIPLIRKLLLR